jgi:hypothetical protein
MPPVKVKNSGTFATVSKNWRLQKISSGLAEDFFNRARRNFSRDQTCEELRFFLTLAKFDSVFLAEKLTGHR